MISIKRDRRIVKIERIQRFETTYNHDFPFLYQITCPVCERIYQSLAHWKLVDITICACGYDSEAGTDLAAIEAEIERLRKR